MSRTKHLILDSMSRRETVYVILVNHEVHSVWYTLEDAEKIADSTMLSESGLSVEISKVNMETEPEISVNFPIGSVLSGIAVLGLTSWPMNSAICSAQYMQRLRNRQNAIQSREPARAGYYDPGMLRNPNTRRQT